MGRLIDTSVLIDAEKRRVDLRPHLLAHAGETFFVSVITASELLHGVHRARDAGVRNKRSAIVEGFIGQFAILGIDIDVARAHSRLWADLELAGNVIGPHDLWLAATCLTKGLAMVTANLRDFERVPGLTVEAWT